MHCLKLQLNFLVMQNRSPLLVDARPLGGEPALGSAQELFEGLAVSQMLDVPALSASKGQGHSAGLQRAAILH